MADTYRAIDPEAGTRVYGLASIETSAAVPTLRVRADGRPLDYPGPGPTGQHAGLAKFLHKSDDTAVKDMAGINGSVTPVKFEIGPPSDEDYEISNLRLVLADTGINYSQFGGITALTNGLLVRIVGDPAETVYFDMLDGLTIKDNVGLASHFTSGGVAEITGGTLDVLMGNVDMVEDLGTRMILDGALNQKLQVVIQDNLTGLTSFKIKALGYKVTRT